MAAYDQLWENIRAQHNEDDVALAERAVKWVLCALEPPISLILLEAVRYSLEGDVLVQKEKRSEEDILLLCQDLLTIDAEKKIWMLPHASVAEYFESRNMTLGACDVFASTISLNFLMRPDLQPPRYKGNEKVFHSFERYTANRWLLHVQRYDRWLGSMESAEPDQNLVATLKRFLGSVEESSDHYREWLNYVGPSVDQAVLRPESMALFAICRYGFYYVLRDWWEEGKINEEMALKESESTNNPLTLAAEGGCLPMFKYLVGVIGRDNALAKGYYRAMQHAISGQHRDIVSFLVEEVNLDVNFCYRTTTIVQYTAMFPQHAELLQWLVDQGWVDVNREGGKHFGNALIAAASYYSATSVEILLKAGADVNAAVECGYYGSALVAAASSTVGWEYVKKVRLLLRHGADPNQLMRGGKYGSALEAVIVRGFRRQAEDKHRLAEDMPMMKLLLKAGADPAIITDRGDHGSALAAAACCGFKDFLEMMVDVVGRERAIECLGQSRCPKKLYLRTRDGKRWMQAKSDIIAYLTNQVGVEKETLYRIGLRDVELEPSDSGVGFIIRYY